MLITLLFCKLLKLGKYMNNILQSDLEVGTLGVLTVPAQADLLVAGDIESVVSYGGKLCVIGNVGRISTGFATGVEGEGHILVTGSVGSVDSMGPGNVRVLGPIDVARASNGAVVTSRGEIREAHAEFGGTIYGKSIDIRTAAFGSTVLDLQQQHAGVPSYN
jgi:hypothetical protein